MHTIKFYPVNNGDTCLITTSEGKKILLDFRQHPNGTDANKPEADVNKLVKSDLESSNQDYLDVVGFTHADKDHIEGSTKLLWLEHAIKYQDDDRIKVNELWVPALMLIENAERDKQSEEFVILRQEARHRLKEGKGIRIFSKPDELVSWMEANDIDVASKEHLFVDAGSIVDTFSLDTDKIEFFCHSPFIRHTEGGGKEIRNQAALIFNVRFDDNGEYYDFFAVGDSEWEVLEDIVNVSQYHDNEDRLAWDIFKAPHHCSYLALSDEKGEKITTPKPQVEALLQAGKKDAYIISSSKPITAKPGDYEEIQPPHIQARKCYEKYLKEVNGREFLVTMEQPSAATPKPISVKIENGVFVTTAVISGTTTAGSKPTKAG